MKIDLKKALLCFAITASSLQGNSQNQQYVVPPVNVNETNNPATVTPITGASSAACGVANGAYDASGNLLFYIKDKTLYSASSASLGTLPSPAGGAIAPEIEIVPVPTQEKCNKFFVIYNIGGFLCYVTADFSSISTPTITPQLSTTLPFYSNNKILPGPSVGMGGSYELFGGLAVSKLTTLNTRYLFAIGTPDCSSQGTGLGGIYRFTISSTGISNSQTPLVTNASLGNYFQSYFGSLTGGVSQISLSPDQSRLGWGGNTGTLPNIQGVFEIKLDPSYNMTGSLQVYPINSNILNGYNCNNNYSVPGVIYDGNNKMWVSTQSGIYSLSNYGGTFSIDAYSGGLNVNSSSSVECSQLRYVPASGSGSGLIVGAAPTTAVSTGKFFSLDPATGVINSTYLSGTSVNNVYAWGGGQQFYTLSDQIDGDVITYPNLVASVSSSDVCAGNSIVVNTSYTGNTTPNNYYLEIDQCSDQYGNNPVLVSSAWYPGAPPSTIPIPNSNTLTCGKYYKVVFAVQNTSVCFNWAEATTVVSVNCTPRPVILGNTAICSSSSSNSSTQLCASPSGSPYTFNWTIGGIRGIYSTNSCITVNPTTNTTYNLTVTNSTTGCSASTSQLVTVAVNNPSFNWSVNTNSTSYATINAWAPNNTPTTLNPGYKYMYILQEVDNAVNQNQIWVENNNPCAWWNFPAQTTFNGINNTGTDYPSNWAGLSTACPSGFVQGTQCTNPPAGEFAYGKTYIITLGTWIINTTNGNTVCPWQQYPVIITTPPTGGRMFEESTVIVGSSIHDFSYLQSQQATTSISNISDENVASKVTIYPNPNNGNFTIETPLTTTQLVEVYDLTGRLMLSQTISGSTSINAGSLLDGMYNIKISGNNTVVNKRVIISK